MGLHDVHGIMAGWRYGGMAARRYMMLPHYGFMAFYGIKAA